MVAGSAGREGPPPGTVGVALAVGRWQEGPGEVQRLPPGRPGCRAWVGGVVQSLPEAPRPWQLRLLPAPLPPEPEGPSSLRPGPLQPDSLEDPAGAAEGAQEPEAEAPGGPSSEPGTPRAGRSGMRAGGCSRAERCAGVHISDPYNVNLPLHITSILSVPPNIISNVSLARLTRGLECPALQPRPSPASGPGPPGEDRGTSALGEGTRTRM